MSELKEGLLGILITAIMALLLWIGLNADAFGQIPELQIIDIADFSGGLNTRDGSGGIADNEQSESLNCFIDWKGISKRNGYDAYMEDRINGTNVGTGIFYAPFASGSVVVATAGTAIAYKNGSAWTDITGSVSLTADEPMMFAMVNNNLVGCNGTDAPWYWSGSGDATTLSGSNIPTAPAALAEFHGRLFLSDGRRLRWSRYMGDWTEFHPDDYQDFNEPIKGLCVLGDVNNSVLVVLCTRSIHYAAFDADMGAIIGGRGTFRFDHISYVHGCISPYSVRECVTPEGELVLIWADTDGLKMLSPAYKIMKVSDKIDPTWKALDATQITKSIGFNYKTRQWYGLIVRNGSSSANDRVIIYDLRKWCVSGLFDWPMSTAGILKTTGQDILVGSDNSGYWMQYDYGDDDNGAAITAWFITKSFDGGFPLLDKRWSSINFQYQYVESDTLDIINYYDYGRTASEVGSSLVTQSQYVGLGDFQLDLDVLADANGNYAISGVETSGSAQYCMTKIYNDTLSTPFKIYRMQLTYKPNRMVIGR